MRAFAVGCAAFALSTSALAGPIADQFAAGVRGVSWGMTLDELIAVRPGGEHNARSCCRHGLLRCLDEVLLHAQCDEAVFYAAAAPVVANLIHQTAAELDSVHLR
jgi:hypothetical protein